MPNGQKATVRSCDYCGTPFEGRRRTCSTACLRIALGMNGHRTRSPRTCVVCGVVFRRKTGGDNIGICCSRTCGFAYQRERRHVQKQERQIQQQATRDHARDVRTFLKRARIDLRMIQAQQLCGECGQLFVPFRQGPKYGRTGVKYCSKQCCVRHNRRIRRRQRRARERQAPREAVDPRVVFARDRWRCQLCGCRTPRRYVGQMRDDAPELDHIVPLAIGGSHTYANTQCTCRRCNGAKGATVRGQLRLV